MRISKRIALLCATTSGCVFGVDPLERVAKDTHPAEGIRGLSVAPSAAWKELSITGGRDEYAASMTTIEWRSPGDTSLPTVADIVLVPFGDLLGLQLSGGGESLTRRALALEGPRTMDVDADISADQVLLTNVSGRIGIESDGDVVLAAVAGDVAIDSVGTIEGDVTGTFDLVSDTTITVAVAGTGYVDSPELVYVEIADTPTGPIDITTDSTAFLYISPETSATLILEATGEGGSISVTVGGTDVLVDTPVSPQSFDIGGGGPEVYVTGAAVVVEDP